MILSFSSNPYPNQVEVKNSDLLPEKIIIDRLGIDVNIVPGKIVDGVWEISPDSATYLVGSSTPQETGNIVIYGHNKKAIFGKLSVIKMGDEIQIITHDGKIYKYGVNYIKWVNPNEVSVIAPTDFPVLTIYTCTGFLDSYRLVVKAIPLS